ncbi:conserved hypothetical protein [Paraburkholderia tropica]|uniref:DUF1488 domain-containing protein n=1 Tax=Paraburkholderia TaxID=1822464 RepID=UPI001CAB89F9|nr:MULTISPECIES: DUF1488 domain-containing protein [Paraburkholderia]CAG9226057.1 conserved hypothetical protein [Paraburkholderia tropica]
MRIEFTNRRHSVAASRIAFEAHVDDRPVWCSVSMDALNARFGNEGTSSHALLSAFDANRPTIERAARHALTKNGGQSLELEPGDFS